MGIVIDTWSTHDINLARQLTKYLEVGDIILGDRAYECLFRYLFVDEARF